MKPLKLIIILSFCLSCGNNQTNKNAGSKNIGLDTIADTYSVTEEDASMNSAIDRAKKTINHFDQALMSHNPAFTDFAVKIKYKTPDGGGEQMWITEIEVVNGDYKGIVNNDPENTSVVKYGDTVIVRRNEITDWMYLENNVLVGGYTIREIRNKLSKEERIKMDKEMSFIIKD
jgi:uncharacterized protein YegJ (DUF2314 family)